MLDQRPSSLSGLPLVTVAVLAIGLVAWALAGLEPRAVRAEVGSAGVDVPREGDGLEGLDSAQDSAEPRPPPVIAEAMTLALSGVGTGRVAAPLAEDGELVDPTVALAEEQATEGPQVGDDVLEVEGPRAEGELRGGLPQGPWTIRYADGKLLAEGSFDAGLPTGPWQWWHANGRESVAGTFTDGQPEGTWLAWHESGSALYETGFAEGEEDGARTEWHENGRVSLRGSSAKGLREGTWTQWYQSGAMKSVVSYRNGLREGRWVKWHESGLEMERGHYRRGRPQGRWNEWYSNGQLEEGGSYATGKRTGKWEFYLFDGTPDRRTGNYKNGKKAR